MESFIHALRGIGVSLRTQKHMRFHLVAAVGVVICGTAFAVSPAEWIALVLTIAIVFAAELLNTAIESAVDLVTSEFDEQAKRAKDAAAAAVLAVAVAAAIVGTIIFVPRICSALAG